MAGRLPDTGGEASGREKNHFLSKQNRFGSNAVQHAGRDPHSSTPCCRIRFRLFA